MTQTPTDALRLVPIDMQIESILHDLVEEVSAAQRGARVKARARQCCARGAAKNALLNILAAAPASPLPGGGWRTDFENAPKDGSVFMVGYDDEAAKKAGLFENKDRVYEARWNDIQSTWSARNGFILHSDATHWMPLPAAPTGDA